jgi:hypothetical protein
MKTILIDTRTAAKLLDVCQQRVNQFVHDGRLVLAKVEGIGHRFRRVDVMRLASRRRKPGRPKKSGKNS